MVKEINKQASEITDLQLKPEFAAAQLTQICHKAAADAGWWTDIKTGDPLVKNNGELFALIHSEISEAMEADRKDLMDDKLPHRKGIEVELADAAIRIFDMAGGLKLDIAGAIAEKLDFNAKRADHKPENRIKEGGEEILMLSHFTASTLVFAARYAHSRKTAAAHVTVAAIIENWEQIPDEAKRQLIREAENEATCNHDDWEKLIEMGVA